MKMSRITAALLAATMALTAVGCGDVGEDKSAAAAVSETGGTAETQAAETTAAAASAAETASAGTSGKLLTAEEKIRELGEAEGIDDSSGTRVKYKPSYEEAATLAELAVKQYNAVLERDGETYFETLSVKDMFEDVEFKSIWDELIMFGNDVSARVDVFTYYSIILIDNVMMNHADHFEKRTSTMTDEEFDAFQDEFVHLLAASPDEGTAGLFPKYYPEITVQYDDLDSSYFSKAELSYLLREEPETGVKTVSGDLTYKVMLTSSEEIGSTKYIMADITVFDGDEELLTMTTAGFINGSKAGVYTDDYEIAAYEAYKAAELAAYKAAEAEALKAAGADEDIDPTNIILCPLSEAEKNILIGLAIQQYNAIVSRDAEEYLKTLNIKGLFGSEDTAAEEEKQQSEARDTLGKCVRNVYMTPLRDKQKLDGGSFPASADVIDEEFIKQAVKAGKSKGDVMMNYVNELFFLNGEDGKCTNAPLSEATFDIEVRETEKAGDVVYADFCLTFQAQGEEHTLWRCMGWISGSKAGVYVDMIDRTELEPYEYEQDDDSEQ